MTKRRGESGNVFFTLFGAVALVGVIGVATSTLMRGPVGTVVSLNQKAKVESQLQIARKLVALAAAQRADSDCDGDLMIEPSAPDITGDCGTMITGGGCLPATVGAAKIDPWRTMIGYCGWDHQIDTTPPTGCSNDASGGTLRAGEQSASSAANKTVLAVISAGPDRIFQTQCLDAPDYLQSITPTNDDIVFAWTYDETATGLGGGLWSLLSGDKITTDKDLEIGTDATFASGTNADFQGRANFGAGSTLDLSGGGLLNLPTWNGVTGPTCYGPNIGMLRIDTTVGQTLQICDPATMPGDPDGWVDIGGSGSSSSVDGSEGDIQFNSGDALGASAALNWDGSSLRIGNPGTTNDMLEVNGSAGFGGVVTAEDEILASLGTAADPSYSFIGSDTSGLYNDAGNIGVSVGGLERLLVTNNGADVTGDLDVTSDTGIGGTLYVSSSSVLDDTLDIRGNIFNSVGADVVIGDSLNVTGASNFDAAVTMDSTLDVNGDITGAFFGVDGPGGNDGLDDDGSGGLYLTTNGAGRLHIDSAGDIGIGITGNPTTDLDIDGVFRLRMGSVTAGDACPGLAGAIAYSSGDQLLVCSNIDNEYVTIGTDGGGGGGTVGLWQRLNGAIQPITGQTVDDFLFGAFTLDDDGSNDTRMFFDKSKGAFRAGTVDNGLWDDGNRGTGSVALGMSVMAGGIGSFAVGNDALVQNGADYSMAFGLGDAAGTAPSVSSSNSVAFFMGDQSAVDLNFPNVMLLAGGSLVIDPDTTSATHIEPDNGLAVDVQGNVGAMNFCNELGTQCFTASDIASGSTGAPGSDREVVFNSGGSLWTDGNFVFSSTGRLGIGTNTPDEDLTVLNIDGGLRARIHVDGGSADHAELTLDRGTTSKFSVVRMQTDGVDDWVMGTPDSDATWSVTGTQFYIGPTENALPPFLIDRTTLHTGLGVASPQTQLDVDGTLKLGWDNEPCDAAREGGVHYNSADNNFYVCPTAGAWQRIVTEGSGDTPAGGNDREIQFNSGGRLDGVEDFSYSSAGRLIFYGESNDTAAGTIAQSYFGMSMNPSSAQDAGRYSIALAGDANVSGASSQQIREVRGIEGTATNSGSGNVETMIASHGYSYSNGNTVDTMMGGYFGAENAGSGLVSTLTGVMAEAHNNSAAGATNMTGLFTNIYNNNASATIDNGIGLMIGTPVTTGTFNNLYGLYQEHAGSKNYLAGQVGMGVYSPMTRLDVDGTIKMGYGGEDCDADREGAIHYNSSDNNFYVCKTAGSWDVLATGVQNAAAPDRGVQFNSGGQFTADANFVYSDTGRLAIGNTTPLAELHIGPTNDTGGSNPAFILSRAGNPYMMYTFDGSDTAATGLSSDDYFTIASEDTLQGIQFRINGQYANEYINTAPVAMRIDNNFNVSIGPQTADTRLDVNGTVKIGWGNELCDTNREGAIHYNSADNSFYLCQTAGTWQKIVTEGGTGAPAGGNDREVQFNSGGDLAGIGGFEYGIDGRLNFDGQTDDTTSTHWMGTRFGLEVTPTGNEASGRFDTALVGETSTPASNSQDIQEMRGVLGTVSNSGSGPVDRMVSVVGYSFNNGGGSVNSIRGGYFAADNYSASAVGDVVGIMGYGLNNGTGTLTSLTGIYANIENNNAAGDVDSGYGLFIDTPVNAGTIDNLYGLYQNDVNSQNYFAGNLGIGVPVPTTRLDVDGTIKVGDGGEDCDDPAKAGMVRWASTVMQYCDGAVWQDFAAGATATPGAPDRGIQFNSGGKFAASSDLTFSSAGNLLMAHRLGIGTSGEPTFDIQIDKNHEASIRVQGDGTQNDAIFSMASNDTGDFWQWDLKGDSSPYYGGYELNHMDGTTFVWNNILSIRPEGAIGFGINEPKTRADVAGTLKIAYGNEDCDADREGAIHYNSADHAFYVCKSAGAWDILATGTPAAAAPDRGIQFNSNGSFTADAGLIYSSTGDLLVQGTYTGTPSVPVEGAGSRMFFDVQTGAFRAGNVAGTAWDNTGIGTGSAAFGGDTVASGSNSFAVGSGSLAESNSAVALGYFAHVSGERSLSTGNTTFASGDYSTAMGSNVVAGNGFAGSGLGDGSFAVGLMTPSVAISTRPQITGNQSFGLFMGDQDGVVFAADNTMGLFGGKMVIDPRVPATNLVADTALEVDGTLKIAYGGEDCDADREGAIYYNSGDNNFYFCGNAANGWESVDIGTSSAPGGDREMVFNSGGSLSSSSDLTYSSVGVMDFTNVPSLSGIRMYDTDGDELVSLYNRYGHGALYLADGNGWPQIELSVGADSYIKGMFFRNSDWHVGLGNTDPKTMLDVTGTIKLSWGGEDCDADREGAIQYDSSDQKFYGCSTGGVWQELGSSSDGTFITLTDTPPGYAGNAGKFVRVNSTPDGLEFTDQIIESVTGEPAPSGLALDEIADVDAAAPNDGECLKYDNASGTWVSGECSTGGALLFTDLTDTPAAYGSAGMFVRINDTADGLVFTDQLVEVVSGAPAPNAILLSSLGDVDLSAAPSDGQCLVYDNGAGKWEAASCATAGAGGLWTAGANDDIYYDSGTNPRVGINTTTPSEALDVEGTIRASEGLQLGAVTGAASPTMIALDDLSDVDAPGPAMDDVLKWDGTNWVPGTVTASGSSAFTDLTDTPAAYASAGGMFVRVNTAENALEFTDQVIEAITGQDAPIGLLLDDLDDTDFTVAPNDGECLKYTSSTGKWVAGTCGGAGGLFTDLSDTPTDYASAAGKYVRVNDTQDGLEFTDEILEVVSGQPAPDGQLLSDLDDVDLSVAPADGQCLAYDFAAGKWEAASCDAGGGGLWTAGAGDDIYYNSGSTPQVGIGNTSPTEALDVTGVVKVSDGIQMGLTAGAAAPDTLSLSDLDDVVAAAPNTNDVLLWDGSSWVAGVGGSGGAFTDLSDTPSAYTGEAGSFVRVNTGATGLEFTSSVIPQGTGPAPAGMGMGDLSDVDDTGVGDGDCLVYNAGTWETGECGSGGGIWTDSGSGYIEYDSSLGAMRVASISGAAAPLYVSAGGGGGSLSFPLLASPVGSAGAPAYSFTGDATTGMYAGSTGVLSLATGGTERVRITSAGLRIGAGGDPSKLLHVYGTGDSKAMFEASDGGASAISFKNTQDEIGLGLGSDEKFHIGSDGTLPGSAWMTIDQSGNLGLGTSSPATKFELATTNASAPVFSFTDGAVAHGMTSVVDTDAYYSIAKVTSANGGALIGGYSDGPNTPGIMMEGAIGSNTPTVTVPAFQMRGYKKNGTGRAALASSESVFGVYNGAAAAPSFVIMGNGSIGINKEGPAAALDVVGDVQYTGTLTDVSDMRLKTDIHPLDERGSMLDKLGMIDTYSFTMKDDPAHRVEFGVMAQELEKVFPELVHTAQDEMGTKSVNYIGMIAPMIEATQELKAENESLRSEIENLRAERDELKVAMNDMAQDIKGLKAYTGYGVNRAEMGLWMILIALASGSFVLVLGGIVRNRQRRAE